MSPRPPMPICLAAVLFVTRDGLWYPSIRARGVGSIRTWSRTHSVNGARMSSGANALGVGQTSAHAELNLIEALRQGDEDAFGRLVDQYHTSLRRVARLYVSNRAVADEVVQDTWVGVIQGLWAFEGRSSLRTWVFRILINHAKTRAVREGRTVPFAGVGAMTSAGRRPRSARSASTLRTTRPSPATGQPLLATSGPPQRVGSWPGRRASSSRRRSTRCRLTTGSC